MAIATITNRSKEIKIAEYQPNYFPLDDLLSRRLFRIPHYQRAYSWQHKQRHDMFEDIKQLKDKSEDSFHFMATVVGLRRDTRSISNRYNIIEIVDGQQRLTTLVLLLKAIEKKLIVRSRKSLARDLRNCLSNRTMQVSFYCKQIMIEANTLPTFSGLGITHQFKKQTLADRELLSAIQCESFVDSWGDQNRIVTNN